MNIKYIHIGTKYIHILNTSLLEQNFLVRFLNPTCCISFSPACETFVFTSAHFCQSFLICDPQTCFMSTFPTCDPQLEPTSIFRFHFPLVFTFSFKFHSFSHFPPQLEPTWIFRFHFPPDFCTLWIPGYSIQIPLVFTFHLAFALSAPE